MSNFSEDFRFKTVKRAFQDGLRGSRVTPNWNAGMLSQENISENRRVIE